MGGDKGGLHSVSYILVRVCRMGWGLEMTWMEKKVFQAKENA